MGGVSRLRLRYSPRARREIVSILGTIRRHSANGARNVAGRIDKLVGELRLFPDMGRQSEMDGVRSVSVNPYPYVIFYRRTSDTLEIASVRHAAREDAHDPPL